MAMYGNTKFPIQLPSKGMLRSPIKHFCFCNTILHTDLTFLSQNRDILIETSMYLHHILIETSIYLYDIVIEVSMYYMPVIVASLYLYDSDRGNYESI